MRMLRNDLKRVVAGIRRIEKERRYGLNGPPILATGVLMLAWMGCLFTPDSMVQAVKKDPLSDPGRLIGAGRALPGGTDLIRIPDSGNREEAHPLPSADREPLFLNLAGPPGVNPDRNSDPAFLIRRLLGVDVRSATLPDLRKYNMRIRGGLVIIFAYHHSLLADAGFEANDMIVEVEGRPIEGVRDFAEQVVRLKGKQRILMLGLDHRTGRAGYVQVVVH